VVDRYVRIPKYEASRYQGFPIRATHRTATQRPAQATHLCAPQGPAIGSQTPRSRQAQATPHLASGCCPSTPPPATWSSRTPQVPLAAQVASELRLLLQAANERPASIPDFPTHTHAARISVPGHLLLLFSRLSLSFSPLNRCVVGLRCELGLATFPPHSRCHRPLRLPLPALIHACLLTLGFRSGELGWLGCCLRRSRASGPFSVAQTSTAAPPLLPLSPALLLPGCQSSHVGWNPASQRGQRA